MRTEHQAMYDTLVMIRDASTPADIINETGNQGYPQQVTLSYEDHQAAAGKVLRDVDRSSPAR